MRISDAEWTVMNAVWQRAPASARDILEQTQSDTGWAYSTVKTILDRLVEKGALKVRKRANTSLYEPRLSRQAARGTALQSLLDKAFDGAFGSLVQYMISEERLSKRDRQRLAAMLADAEQQTRGDER